jgi:glycosyltransferase involved in cell wall biosynthesis
MNNYKVFIDASSNIIYASYYLEGLYQIFGKSNVKFSSKHFKSLDSKNDDWSYDSYMSVIIQNDKNSVYKLIIDFGDDTPIRKKAYNWCDVYAKINYCPRLTGDYDKVISVAPSFGIKIWNVYQMAYFSISNLFKLNLKPKVSYYKFFHNYFSQLKLLSIGEFIKLDNLQDSNTYIFSIGSLWHHQNCLEGTNLFRKWFMEISKNVATTFEGGFFLSTDEHPQMKEFEKLIYKKRYPLNEYISKTKKSALVFNTPAVHNCHGWKLGQYLAMGKAIVSMPLQNDLPQSFEHGKNIHFVNNQEQLNEAVAKILSNNEYRKKLEIGAANYFEKYVSPSACIETILNHLETNL